jgi:protein TonB
MELQPIVAASVESGVGSTPHAGLGLGLSLRAAAVGRRRRLLVTNLVSGVIIGAAFGVAVYVHEAQEKKAKEKLRKVAFIQQQQKKPEPPKPKPEAPKPKPKSPPKKQRLKAPDRKVVQALQAPTKVPDKVDKPPQIMEEDTAHGSLSGTDDEDAGEMGGGADEPPPGPTGTGGEGGTEPAPPPPPPPKPKKKTPPPRPIFLRADMQPPERTSGEDPSYPSAASQAGINGTVILLITVSAKGKVTDVKIIKNLPILGEHCARTVRSWRFKPYIVNGVAVPVIVRQPFTFK